MVMQVAVTAKKQIELPPDLMERVKAEAAKQGVSTNKWIALVLAGAVGYRKPLK